MSRCWIALGGNQGPVADTFRDAVALLNRVAGISVTRMSRCYTTSPVGANAGNEFLNAAAELQTTLPPLELLANLQAVETQLGRVRSVHWGPRTLDLDLLLYDEQMLSTPVLTIPHPHMWYRRFVLDPLAEIAPDVIHGGHGLSISELRERLLSRPLKCVLLGGPVDQRVDLQRQLEAEYPQTDWPTESPESAWLAFCFESVPQVEGIPDANRIDVQAFPTAPEQTIRDVLAAALDSVRSV
ncbi:MAG: 2-amino-4-hydroxy-6-hydroxymethyldihydropteridine pyrophosphokinae [Planctomycetaceae bacterium]|nr:2-amino-4-hydroxy-6-hydroxymethyldihydropteridine pyrophosphokinae [Planctomycetaceae bacterium]